MLYCALFCRIQSTEAMTSLSREAPEASLVRTLTMGAFCATPLYRPAPAAREATIVAWPSSSTVPSVQVEQKLTLATTRLPKSPSFVASTPLSTTAIAGACGAGGRRQPGSDVIPVVVRQTSWL